MGVDWIRVTSFDLLYIHRHFT